MLRKCATALAVGLIALSGQAFASQMTTSTVQRVGAAQGASNAQNIGDSMVDSQWGLIFFVIVGGVATWAVYDSTNDDYTPVSPT